MFFQFWWRKLTCRLFLSRKNWDWNDQRMRQDSTIPRLTNMPKWLGSRKGNNILVLHQEVRLFFCFVRPIFSSFGFWYFAHFSCVIFFLFPSCPSCLAKCRQRLRNIFVTSLPKVTKNQKWDERNIYLLYFANFWIIWVWRN